MKRGVTKYVKNSLLLTPQWKAKLAALAAANKGANRQVRRLQQKIDFLISKTGITLTPEIERDVEAVMKESSSEVERLCPAGTFGRLFWDQQMKAMRSKSSNGMRWHPVIIRWALNIRMISSSAYHAIRSSGFLHLPSERTLRDYTHFFRRQAGFQPELNDLLLQEAKLDGHSLNRFVVVVFDEMQIREDLVFDKYNQDITGFVDLGNVNDRLSEVEKSVSGGKKSITPAVATKMLVLMVRGLSTSLRFPNAHFPTTGVTAVSLVNIVWEAIEHLEMLGFAVIAICSDGSGPNRKFFRMHGTASGVSAKNPTYKIQNPYSEDERNIYFLSDPSHLIKTTRNCLSHSSAGSTTRKMHVRESAEI